PGAASDLPDPRLDPPRACYTQRHGWRARPLHVPVRNPPVRYPQRAGALLRREYKDAALERRERPCGRRFEDGYPHYEEEVERLGAELAPPAGECRDPAGVPGFPPRCPDGA